MRNVRMILIGIFMMALSPGSAGAQSGQNLFQQALMQERSYGNLQEAIRLYERIALEFTEDRALTATALVKLGTACEKLGVPGAKDAYRRIVEEFPDQAEQVRTAVARLGALVGPRESGQSGAASQEPTYTLLLDEPPGTHFLFGRLFDLSPDGRQLVLASSSYGPPGIYITDRLGDRPRLIRRFEVGRRNGYPRWSPDGSMIAIMSAEEPGAHIIDREGVLKAFVGFSHLPNDLAWTPDQQGLTYTPRREDVAGVRRVTLDGRETVLAEASYAATNLAGYSPDGRWIAFQDGGWRLKVIPAAGGEVKRTPQSSLAGQIPGMPREPAWGPDGFLYFLPQSDGTQNVWRIKIDPQTGEAVGEPQQVTFYKDAVIRDFGVARDAGNMAYVLRRTRNTIWTAPSNEVDAPRALARGRDPVISPDGATVFFEGEGPGNAGIFSVPTSGGTPRRLTPESHIVVVDRKSWKQLWPDGSRVAYHAWVGEPPSRERAYFQIPVTGGEPVRLPVPGEAYRWPDLSPDGSSLAYGDESGLYIVPVAGGEPTLLAELTNLDQVKWSPDGQYLMVNQYVDANDHYRVYVVPSKGGEPRLLVTEDCQWTGPMVSWHPDSRRLAYPKNGAVWIAYVDGRLPTFFYNEPDIFSWGGQWAPDGETYFSVGWRVWSRNPDGTSEFLWRGFNWPSITPDGRTWAWSTFVESNEMWMIEGFE